MPSTRDRTDTGDVRESDPGLGETARSILETIHEHVDGLIADYADRLARSDVDLDAVGGPQAVAEAVANVLPRPNRLAQRAGPVYTTGQLQQLLPGVGSDPISDQAVRNRKDHGRLVAAKTRDGRWVYPAFQFDVRPGRLQPRDDVLELWDRLPWDADRVDAWTLVAWLRGPRDDLDGATPLEWLDDRGLDDRLRRAAGRVRRRASAA